MNGFEIVCKKCGCKNCRISEVTHANGGHVCNRIRCPKCGQKEDL